MNQPKPIDYRDLLAQDEPIDSSQPASQEEESLLFSNKKKFSLDGLKDWWSVLDIKEKREFVILIVIVMVISLGFLLFYFLRPKPSASSFPLLITPPAEEAEMFGN